ncbi:MAG: YdbH domain-containing protein [Nitrosomonas sp.]|nr:MAG: YdbH domain-containing protein [Nitrosomonas sp.]
MVTTYTFRNSLLEALLGAQLSKWNLPLQSIATLDLTPSGLLIDNLIAGKHEEFRINKARVSWNMHNLFSRSPLSIEINELMANLTMNDQQKHSAPVSPEPILLPTPIDLAWLPAFSLKNFVLQIQSTAGYINIALSGEITPSRENTHRIDFKAMLSGPLAQGSAALAATIDSQGNLQGNTVIADGMLNIPTLSITSLSGRTYFKSNHLNIQHIRTKFSLSDIRLQPNIDDPSMRLAIGQIDLSGDFHGLSDSGSGKLDLTARDGQLTSKAFTIKPFSIFLPLQFKHDKTGSVASLYKPATVTMKKILRKNHWHISRPLQLSIISAKMEMTREIEDWRLRHEIVMTADPINIRSLHRNQAASDMEIYPGRITANGAIKNDKHYEGQITFSGTALHLPQLHLQSKNIISSINMNAPERGTAINFFIEDIEHRSQQPLFAALTISGNLSNIATNAAPPIYALKLNGSISNTHLLSITAQHQSDTGNGTLFAKLEPLVFSPGNLQPGSLLPVLDQLHDVYGEIQASAQLKWSATGLQNSKGKLTLNALSFITDAIQVTKLNMQLDSHDLFSLNSSPHQTITAQRIDLGGVPMENLHIDYQIKSSDSLRVVLENARFSMMDGVVSLNRTDIIPTASSDLTIHVNNFDLETFFKLIQVDGLSGSGHLDGKIPITFLSNQIVITEGYLIASSSGVLRLKSSKASQLLSTSGQEVAMVLQILQDFHYSELKLHLDKSAEHDLILKLAILGRNPEVNDGQEFHLNIKFETVLDKILQAINQGYHLSDMILDGSFRFH